jgi:hypothetical protein
MLTALLVIIFILTIPALAMRLTDEIRWGLNDFVILGILLISTALIYLFFIVKLRSRNGRRFTTIILVVSVLILWAELAVGIID